MPLATRPTNAYSLVMDQETHDGEFSSQEWPALVPGRIVPGLPPYIGRERARLWALVLTSRGVPCTLEQLATVGWEIRVPQQSLARAEEEIARYEESNRAWPPPLPPPRPMVENTLVTLSVLILLATFHNFVRLELVLPGGIHPDWLEIGSARAGLVLDGDWWRLVTSLTLHRDVAHLLGNLCIGGVFVFILCRELGSGLAWSLIIAAGSLGNLLNALVQPAVHDSVGGSTAVFGTVGILAALSAVRYRHHLRKRWGLPVAAALSLLVLLGSEGKDTDLGAHLFGLLAGVSLGLVTEIVIARRGCPGPVLNALLAIVAALAIAVSWFSALALAR